MKLIGFRKSWNLRALLLLVFDIIIINFSSFFALWMRFDFVYSRINSNYITSVINYMPVHTGATVLVFVLFRLYHSLWRSASVNEMIYIIWAHIGSFALLVYGMNQMDYNMPRSYYFLSIFIQMFLITGLRFGYRIIRRIAMKIPTGMKKENVMIIGAGEAGRVIIKEILNSHDMAYNIKCLIDDDNQKVGRFINGIQVAGTKDSILEVCKKYSIDLIILAIPTVSSEAKRDILQICKETSCELKILPGMYQLINGQVSTQMLRSVEIEDLLGREQIKVNLSNIMSYVSDKTVLVTGGGGSIGSELCRQIATFAPKMLIIFEIYENSAYEIQNELKRRYPELDLKVLIGSVRNTNRVDDIFATYKPDIVYHAAAHKHVPLMEDSPNEAIKNNVFGTYKVASAAHRYKAEKFVLISTDKAVNPTNIMGASKRMCEMVVQMFSRKSDTEFVAVRFGNVLGSNGSVIPLFKKQIEEGGPVTVTHKDIIRYFMTISEAVSLVLQAGYFAKGGEIFVLDMGEPVKIVDMANNLIKLSGYTPGVDINIEFTGLRPGEKLYEELLMDEEGLEETPNKLIFIGQPIDIDFEAFEQELERLRVLVREEAKDIKDIVARIVPTYKRKTKSKVVQVDFNNRKII